MGARPTTHNPGLDGPTSCTHTLPPRHRPRLSLSLNLLYIFPQWSSPQPLLPVLEAQSKTQRRGVVLSLGVSGFRNQHSPPHAKGAISNPTLLSGPYYQDKQTPGSNTHSGLALKS